MKQFKKLLAFVVAMLILCCLPVSAAETITEEVYVTAGTEYTLPETINGVAVTWDVADVATDGLAKRLVTGTTEDGTPVELIVNVGIKTPTVLDNFDNRSGNITSTAINTVGNWATQSVNKSYIGYQKEESGNTYLHFVNGKTTWNDYTGIYGASYQMTSGAFTGKVSVEAKVRLQADVRTEMEIRFRPTCTRLPTNQYTNAETPLYALGRLSKESDNGYWYRDLYDGNATKNTIRLTECTDQWLNLRWDFDLDNATYTLYCNGEEKVTIENCEYSDVANELQYIQFRWDANSKDLDSTMDVDDLVVTTEADAENDVLYYGEAVAPTTNLLANETAKSTLIPTTLVTEADGVVTETDKSLGVIVEPLKEALPGKFTTPLSYYETAKANWNVYKLYDVINESFEEGTTYKPDAQNTIENGVLKVKQGLGANSTARSYEDTAISVSADKDIVELELDLQLERIKNGQNFYIQLKDGSVARLQMAFTSSINTGYWNMECTKVLCIPGDSLGTVSGQADTIKVVIDNVAETITFYVEDVLQKKVSFTDINYTPGALNNIRTYFIQRAEGSEVVDAYIDNLRVTTYETVASVDADSVLGTTTVVRGQNPVLPAYATTTLTDGTTSKLPVIWNEVNTSVAGEVTATGIVDGYTDETGAAVAVTTTVNVLPFPYTVAVQDGAIAVNALTGYKPAAQIYLAIYDETGALKDVSMPFAIDAETVWEDGVATYTLTEAEAGASYRAFVWNQKLAPLAE